MPGKLIIPLVLLFLSGCEPQEALVTQTPDYHPVTSIKQTMEWILDPAVDVIWESAGTIITAEGRRELTPTTEKGWELVRNSAALVAESGNLLMIPGRSLGKNWAAFARELTLAGDMALKAAESKDGDALFEAGGRIYTVCRSCHQQYLIAREEPLANP